MSRVTDTDRGAAALLARARQLAGGEIVKVGVLDDRPKRKAASKRGEKLSLLEVAAVHEFGAPAAGIPQRSFIRATIDAHAPEIVELQATLAAQVVAGKLTARAALDMIGAKVAAMCQSRIAEGIAPALKPATVRRKGSSKPLVDTGQLRSSITWRVE